MVAWKCLHRFEGNRHRGQSYFLVRIRDGVASGAVVQASPSRHHQATGIELAKTSGIALEEVRIKEEERTLDEFFLRNTGRTCSPRESERCRSGWQAGSRGSAITQGIP